MMREVRRFEFTCDGYTTEGKRCRARSVYDAYSKPDAEKRATRDLPYPWREDHRGWICGSTEGHRGDR